MEIGKKAHHGAPQSNVVIIPANGLINEMPALGRVPIIQIDVDGASNRSVFGAAPRADRRVDRREHVEAPAGVLDDPFL